jgi:hypothetical protein
MAGARPDAAPSLELLAQQPSDVKHLVEALLALGQVTFDFSLHTLR